MGRGSATVALPCANVTKVGFGGPGPERRVSSRPPACGLVRRRNRAAQPLAGGLFAFDAPAPGLAAAPASVCRDERIPRPRRLGHDPAAAVPDGRRRGTVTDRCEGPGIGALPDAAGNRAARCTRRHGGRPTMRRRESRCAGMVGIAQRLASRCPTSPAPRTVADLDRRKGASGWHARRRARDLIAVGARAIGQRRGPM